MAMDHLSIQGSATPVERIWSGAKLTDDPQRNRMSSKRLEALQFLKAQYRKLRAQTLTIAEQEALNTLRRRLIDDANLMDDVINVDIDADDLEDCLWLSI
jgi:DNA repair ATPase RecN